MDDPFESEEGSATPSKVKFATEEISKNAPPSYGDDDDANLSNVDLGNEEKRQNIFPSDMLSNSSGSISQGAVFEVTVSDPEKKGDGLGAFVTYKVNTKVEYSPGKFRQSSVVRRYSDFVWLRKKLVARDDGWIVAPLPEKAIIGRFSPMFVDSRRRGLELFLIRLSRHKGLAESEDLKLFLHGGQDFEEVRAGRAVAPSEENKPAKGFMDYFVDLTTTVSNTLGTTKEREKSKDDITCGSIEAYADALEEQVSSTQKNIATLTKKTKEIANAWFDFGFACTLLGQFETEQEEHLLGNAFAKLGNCADRLSVLITQKVDTQMIHFQEPFEDFIRHIEAVKEALKGRTNVQQVYYTALTILEAKKGKLESYQGKMGKEDKALVLEREVMEAQRDVDEKLRLLQTVTERLFAEVARFRQEKRSNFKNVLLDFVRTQIESAKKTAVAWESIINDIQSMPYEGPAL